MKLKIILTSLCAFLSLNLFPVIRIVCSAALTDSHFEFRKQQYVESFTILKNLGHENFYIIEALKKNGPTFLEQYSSHVFYAAANNPRLKNNGINEARTFLEGCIHFNFDPEDIIVKLTGRYSLMSDFLLKTIRDNQDIDAFVKVDENGNVYTLGFAMRYKYLKEMYETIDYGQLERDVISIEYRVGDYIKKQKRKDSFKVMYLEKLYITANLYGSSTTSILHQDVRTW